MLNPKSTTEQYREGQDHCISGINNSAKGGLPQLWELFTVILCAAKISDIDSVGIWTLFDVKLKLKA